jgi:hypothetical protein
MDDANPALEIYRACPYRNVDAAFARFYEGISADENFGSTTAPGSRVRLKMNDVGDWMHRLVLKRRETRLGLQERKAGKRTANPPRPRLALAARLMPAMKRLEYSVRALEHPPCLRGIEPDALEA